MREQNSSCTWLDLGKSMNYHLHMKIGGILTRWDGERSSLCCYQRRVLAAYTHQQVAKCYAGCLTIWRNGCAKIYHILLSDTPLKLGHLVLLISSFSDCTPVPLVLVPELHIYYYVSNATF